MIHLSRRKGAGELSHLGKVSLIDFKRQNPGLPCFCKSRSYRGNRSPEADSYFVFFDFHATLSSGMWRLIHSKKSSMSDPGNQVDC